MNLSTPRVRVFLETPNPGEYLTIDVQTDNRDLIEWDARRAQKGWPKGTDAPSLWMTFLAWHAARRSGGPVAEKFEEFATACAQVLPIDRDGEPLTAAGVAGETTPGDSDGDGFPTRPEPVTASSSN
jgi:hypothetical protein